MIVSFDFDFTLGEDAFQKLAGYIKAAHGTRVLVITSRKTTQHANADLWSVTKRLGIPPEDVHFTEDDWKWKKVKELGVNMHFDDVPEECELIALHVETCIPVLVWDIYCRGSIIHESFGKDENKI